MITSTVIPWVGCLLAIRVACGFPRLCYGFILYLVSLLFRFVLVFFALSLPCLVLFLFRLCLLLFCFCASYAPLSVCSSLLCACIVLMFSVSFSFSASVLHFCHPCPALPAVSPFVSRCFGVSLSISLVCVLLALYCLVFLLTRFSVCRLIFPFCRLRSCFSPCSVYSCCPWFCALRFLLLVLLCSLHYGLGLCSWSFVFSCCLFPSHCRYLGFGVLV